MHAEQPVVLKLGKGAAHGFEFEAEIAADLFARHAQNKFGRRVAARGEAPGQVEQEGGQPLLGAHAAQQQHDAVVAHDFAAHHPVKMALQQRELVE